MRFCVVVMQKKGISFRSDSTGALRDCNVAQYLSEFIVYPLRAMDIPYYLGHNDKSKMSKCSGSRVQIKYRQAESLIIGGMKKWIERLNKCVTVSGDYVEKRVCNV
ncbi:hypothetical protein TNCV_1262231 [Trichonephila clavipes]|nr:hypothetical protein TNCV_1262231 [Trichonephila clavipes]